jgi:hypothetical protein
MRSIESRVRRLKRQVYACLDEKGILNALHARFFASVSSVIADSDFDFLKFDREIPSTPAYRAAHRLASGYLHARGLAHALAGANSETRGSFAALDSPADEPFPDCRCILALLGSRAPARCSPPPVFEEEEEPGPAAGASEAPAPTAESGAPPAAAALPTAAFEEEEGPAAGASGPGGQSPESGAPPTAARLPPADSEPSPEAHSGHSARRRRRRSHRADGESRRQPPAGAASPAADSGDGQSALPRAADFADPVGDDFAARSEGPISGSPRPAPEFAGGEKPPVSRRRKGSPVRPAKTKAGLPLGDAQSARGGLPGRRDFDFDALIAGLSSSGYQSSSEAEAYSASPRPAVRSPRGRVPLSTPPGARQHSRDAALDLSDDAPAVKRQAAADLSLSAPLEWSPGVKVKSSDGSLESESSAGMDIDAFLAMTATPKSSVSAKTLDPPDLSSSDGRGSAKTRSAAKPKKPAPAKAASSDADDEWDSL